MKYQYHVTISEVSPEKEGGGNVEFDFPSHDNLLEIIEKMNKKNFFSEDEVRAFCVGLKLFSGVMLAHRDHPLFADFSQSFGLFMKKLKS
ncbi:DUF3861 domain-containing protein [Telmatospirillum siberiense]|uniref:DUF3861 domain-containing protein n=1 Tax=Telmatospirillum siberiense TaxID=382514 RepID=A0A2N3PWP9_9PROT|nr:DUF3861 domain-containing protein [Telmatospirillum siberiense]PKU24808.1 DUF3861 domain-containing protein [Telmatospirillum siberiense]